MVCKLLILGSEKGQDQIEEQLMANFKLLPNPFMHKTQHSQMLYTSEQVLKSLVKKHSRPLFTGCYTITIDIELISHYTLWFHWYCAERTASCLNYHYLLKLSPYISASL